MTWRTHFTGGVVLATWLLAPLVPASDLGVVALAAGFGALVPDLDTPFSHLALFSVRSGSGPGTRPFEGAATLLSEAFGHRGELHSLAGIAVLSLAFGIPLSALIQPVAGWAFALGYGSHLLLDAMTMHGIPLLLPWRRIRFHALPAPLRFSTGSSVEDLLFAFLAAPTVAVTGPTSSGPSSVEDLLFAFLAALTLLRLFPLLVGA